MAQSIRPRVEVVDDDIIVTMPGTNFHVTYRKGPDAGLIASDFMSDDRDAPISRAEFLAMALRIANAKARELGWSV